MQTRPTIQRPTTAKRAKAEFKKYGPRISTQQARQMARRDELDDRAKAIHDKERKRKDAKRRRDEKQARERAARKAQNVSSPKPCLSQRQRLMTGFLACRRAGHPGDTVEEDSKQDAGPASEFESGIETEAETATATATESESEAEDEEQANAGLQEPLHDNSGANWSDGIADEDLLSDVDNDGHTETVEEEIVVDECRSTAPAQTTPSHIFDMAKPGTDANTSFGGLSSLLADKWDELMPTDIAISRDRQSQTQNEHEENKIMPPPTGTQIEMLHARKKRKTTQDSPSCLQHQTLDSPGLSGPGALSAMPFSTQDIVIDKDDMEEMGLGKSLSSTAQLLEPVMNNSHPDEPHPASFCKPSSRPPSRIPPDKQNNDATRMPPPALPSRTPLLDLPVSSAKARQSAPAASRSESRPVQAASTFLAFDADGFGLSTQDVCDVEF